MQMSILSGADTSFRQRNTNTYVDTVAVAAYKKGMLESIRLYDERLNIGEDLEMN